MAIPQRVPAFAKRTYFVENHRIDGDTVVVVQNSSPCTSVSAAATRGVLSLVRTF